MSSQREERRDHAHSRVQLDASEKTVAFHLVSVPQKISVWTDNSSVHGVHSHKRNGTSRGSSLPDFSPKRKLFARRTPFCVEQIDIWNAKRKQKNSHKSRNVFDLGHIGTILDQNSLCTLITQYTLDWYMLSQSHCDHQMALCLVWQTLTFPRRGREQRDDQQVTCRAVRCADTRGPFYLHRILCFSGARGASPKRGKKNRISGTQLQSRDQPNGGKTCPVFFW